MTSLTVRNCLRQYLKARHGLIVDHGRAVIAANKLNKEIGKVFVGKNIYSASLLYAKHRAAEGVSASTIRRELGVLKAAMHYAVNVGTIPYGPPIYIAAPSSPKFRVLDGDEVEDLVQEAEQRGGWIRNFVLILLLTGQRKEAVLGLKWSQVDMKGRVICFTDQTLSLNERRKGRGTVPINDELRDVLNQIAASGGIYGEYVIHKEGDPNTRITAIYNAWNSLTEAVGLKGVTPHTLRHTVATNLVRNKENIYQVSKLLGHASVQTTERVYVTFDHEPLREMVNGISAKGTTKETT